MIFLIYLGIAIISIAFLYKLGLDFLLAIFVGVFWLLVFVLAFGYLFGYLSYEIRKFMEV